MAQLRINIKLHAKEQFRRRDPKHRAAKTLRPLVESRLRKAIRLGAKLDDRGALRVWLGAGLVAICYPEVGEWVVVTVIGNQVREPAG